MMDKPKLQILGSQKLLGLNLKILTLGHQYICHLRDSLTIFTDQRQIFGHLEF